MTLATPAVWTARAEALDRIAGSLQRLASDLDGGTGRLAAEWRGEAADAATARLRGVSTHLRGYARVLHDAGVVGAGLARGLTEAHVLAATGLTGVAAQLAERADAEAAQRLRELCGDLPGRPPSTRVPPAGTDPAAVRGWWLALAEVEREQLLADSPELIGPLDGIPVQDRDQANRTLLRRLRETRPAPGDRTGAALDAIAARLDRFEPARAYLLGIDPRGDGRVVLAVGNPDHARDVLTYVPGTGAGLAHVPGELERTDRLARHSGASTVLWLGYDAPDDLLAATSPEPARCAEDDLHRFQTGLRVTHEGPRAHATLLGYSYGSAVVGFTARDRGVAADDLVLLASPGAGVDRAAELGVARVWSSTAPGDPISYTGLGRSIGGPLLPVHNPDQLWFGRDPASETFGARRFASTAGPWWDPVGTHSRYLDEGNTALDAVGAITRGESP